MFQLIDMETWDRADTFRHFIEADCSYSLTRRLDVTLFTEFISEKKLRSFPAFLWCVLDCVNRRREFRMGLDSENRPGFYDMIHAEYTVMNRETKNVDSLTALYDSDFSNFYTGFCSGLDGFLRSGIRPESREDVVLASCVPWFSYEGLCFQMKSNLIFLRPMFTWGKWELRDGKKMLPFTLQMHHAAADGYHCALFFEDLEGILNEPPKYLNSAKPFCGR